MPQINKEPEPQSTLCTCYIPTYYTKYLYGTRPSFQATTLFPRSNYGLQKMIEKNIIKYVIIFHINNNL